MNNFKVGGGLVVNIQKETNFSMEQRRRSTTRCGCRRRSDGHGGIVSFLLLLTSMETMQVVDSDYRKFKATSTILPGVSTVEPEPDPK